MNGDDRDPPLVVFEKQRGIAIFDQGFSQFGEVSALLDSSPGKIGTFQESIRLLRESARAH
jgi:hypothetical protein